MLNSTMRHFLLLVAFGLFASVSNLQAGTRTWDGKHSTVKIEVTIVYFLPSDRQPLPDWKDRVDYYAERITQFHTREFGDQSTLTTIVKPEPFRSARTTEQLRGGDADFIFFRTLEEVHDALKFGAGEHKAFPILLVLSDINWKPLDDFYRLRPGPKGLEHEGNMSGQRHFPGAEGGGARATYLSDRGIGWGLVSGDGWRVPYRGSDCVVYHEGVGHTVGLPHPEPGNTSVMSLGQYHGWISESFLNDDQKERMEWKKPDTEPKPTLFTKFRAVPAPDSPKPGEEVQLDCDWIEGARLKTLRVQVQTHLWGPWNRIETPIPADGHCPDRISLGTFDRPTPVSYRIDATLQDGQDVELWGYLQVRAQEDQPPLPPFALPDLVPASRSARANSSIAPAKLPDVELLPLVDLEKDSVAGKWTMEQGRLTSPKGYGTRVEIPYTPPEEYDLTAIVEPLDEPNGLILGQRSGGKRFLVLLSYLPEKTPVSAIENIDGKNVGNVSTQAGPVFVKGRPAQVICSVRKTGVQVQVDGRSVIDWTGEPTQLSLGDYWETPHKETLFLGAYDCRYRVSRLTLTPRSGEGKAAR